MNSRDRRSIGSSETRRPLLVVLTGLLASEIFHITTTLLNRSEPHAPHPFGPAAHVASVILTGVLMMWVGRQRVLAGPLTAVAGGTVVLAAIVYHVVPVQGAFNNPFRLGATGLQWLSVVLGIVAGLACVVVGLASGRPRAQELLDRHPNPAETR